jgi:hypothetical protein
MHNKMLRIINKEGGYYPSVAKSKSSDVMVVIFSLCSTARRKTDRLMFIRGHKEMLRKW